MGEVNYRIFRIHCGWMSYRYLVDPTQNPPSVQNRASSDSRRKDLRGVGLLKLTMADSRVSRVLRSGRLLLHNVSRVNRLAEGAWCDSTSDWRVKRRWLVLQEIGK